MRITKRQHQVLEFVTTYIDAHGYAPSYREIAEHFGLSALATVHEHITALCSAGRLRRTHNAARSLELVGGNAEGETALIDQGVQQERQRVLRLLERRAESACKRWTAPELGGAVWIDMQALLRDVEDGAAP